MSSPNKTKGDKEPKPEQDTSHSEEEILNRSPIHAVLGSPPTSPTSTSSPPFHSKVSNVFTESPKPSEDSAAAANTKSDKFESKKLQGADKSYGTFSGDPETGDRPTSVDRFAAHNIETEQRGRIPQPKNVCDEIELMEVASTDTTRHQEEIGDNQSGGTSCKNILTSVASSVACAIPSAFSSCYRPQRGESSDECSRKGDQSIPKSDQRRKRKFSETQPPESRGISEPPSLADSSQLSWRGKLAFKSTDSESADEKLRSPSYSKASTLRIEDSDCDQQVNVSPPGLQDLDCEQENDSPSGVLKKIIKKITDKFSPRRKSNESTSPEKAKGNEGTNVEQVKELEPEHFEKPSTSRAPLLKDQQKSSSGGSLADVEEIVKDSPKKKRRFTKSKTEQGVRELRPIPERRRSLQRQERVDIEDVEMENLNVACGSGSSRSASNLVDPSKPETEGRFNLTQSQSETRQRESLERSQQGNDAECPNRTDYDKVPTDDENENKDS